MSKKATPRPQPGTMSIGELARRAGVTTRTVRYYEELGLMHGEPRAPNGYRTYTERHLYGLRLIRRAKLLGLSLAEIKELAEGVREDPTETKLIQRSIEVLTSNLDRAERKRRELDAYCATLTREVTRLKDLLHSRAALA